MKFSSSKILTLFILSFSILFVQNCSNNSPTNPEDNSKTEVTSKDIDSQGGSIEASDTEIIIPPGAFKERQNIKILEFTEDNLFGANAVSDFIILDGLPTEFAKPIKVKIKYTGTISDSSFISVGEISFITSLNRETTTYKLISTTDSAGYLVGYLPPLDAETLSKSRSNSSKNANSLSISLGAVAGLVNYVSSQGHFKITFPASVLTQTYDLADYLESAYSKLKDLGFSYTRRTKWPVNVVVKVLKNDIYGYTTNSMWGNNYGYLEFNFNKMDEAEEMKVSAGHEFFHLVQNLYDPRSAWSKSRSPMPNYWLDEAASVWAEEYFSSKTSYVSPNFDYNVIDVLKGAKTGNVQDECQNYGYGMSSFLKYLTQKEGNDKIVDVYNNISNGKAPFAAISELLPINAGFSWHSYLKSLFTFDIYESNSFRPAILSAFAAGEKQKFVINDASDSVITYNSSLSDLSATIFSVENQFEDMNNNTILEFKCNDNKFQLYKVNSNKSEFLKSGKDILTVDNFKKLTNEGYKIVAVLYNDDYDSPFEHEVDYEMEIRVKMAPKKISAVKFDFTFTGTYQTEEGTSTYYDTFWNDGYVDNTTCEIIGNSVYVQEIYNDSYHNKEVLTELVFDNIDNPENVLSIKCTETDYYIPGESKIVRLAEAVNIPISQIYDNGTRNFRIDGNISQNLLDLNYVETDNNNSIIKKLLSYQSEGSIEIMIYYEQ